MGVRRPGLTACVVVTLGISLPLTGCGDSDHVDCGGPVEWTSLEAEVISVAEPVTGSSGVEHASVVVREDTGQERTLMVWGRPDEIEIGDRYLFEVDQYAEAFVGYEGELECYDDLRLSVPLARRAATD